MSKLIVVVTTAPDEDQAATLARELVEHKLAACVQIIPAIRSFYSWEGETADETEHLLLIKTITSEFEAVKEFISNQHSYDVPEIVGLEAADVSESYLGWVAASVG